MSLMLQRAPVRRALRSFTQTSASGNVTIASARAGEAAQPIRVDDRAATLEQQPQDAVDLDEPRLLLPQLKTSRFRAPRFELAQKEDSVRLPSLTLRGTSAILKMLPIRR